ncbi:hypothetical protein [Catellatospora sp. NPDC049609]|uniref:hypothetical protein n=1 Tax=Catellatospora sp. NPDC049609 TaxID=3155505 RepID=UPI003412E558
MPSSPALPAAGPSRRRPHRPDWYALALRAMAWIAYPALAGLAFLLLSLAVVTWLPAYAAAGHALHRWRTGEDERCFTGTIRAFGGYWRALWRHSLASTLACAVLVTNVVFLAGQPSPAAFALLAAQVGVLAALVPYHLALAAVAAVDGPDPRTDRAGLRRRALVLAFGSPRRGLLLLAAAVAAPLVALPLAVGPLLFGPTLPLLLALHLAAPPQDR